MTLLHKSVKETLDHQVTLLQKIDETNTELVYTGLTVLSFKKGGQWQETLLKKEACVVALVGQITVTEGDNSFKEIGRRQHLFEKIPTDSVYISNDKSYQITAETDARVLIAYSPSHQEKPTCLIPAEQVELEHRGKYNNQRYCQTILSDQSGISNSLLVVEVYTEGGNWSSYPPHKHDEDNLPKESFLEEIYYHEIDPDQGFVVQKVYTEDRKIDETMTVETQDVVEVPKGYHPVGVPDGYTSYYLNVMAGPTKLWKFHNQKEHEWILSRD